MSKKRNSSNFARFQEMKQCVHVYLYGLDLETILLQLSKKNDNSKNIPTFYLILKIFAR
jgi:hypothetical protein